MGKIRRLWSLVFFFFLVGLFFWPTLLQGRLPFPGDLLVAHHAPWKTEPWAGIPHKAQGGDAIRMMYPWRRQTLRTIGSYQWPLWNPHNFSGNPHLANFQTAVFYPLNLIFFVFPQDLAWALYILLQPFLAAIFTFLFLRNLKVSSLAALLAGVGFGFSAFMIAWLLQGNFGHTFLWLPLILLAVDLLIKKQDRKSFLFLTLALAISLSAGYLQAAFYLYLVGGLYFLFRWLSFSGNRSRLGLVFLSALFLSLALLGVQIIPTLELISHSARSPFSLDFLFKSLVLKPYHLVGLLAPDFFGNPATRNYFLEGTYVERVIFVGIAPLVFAVYALLKKRTKTIRFFGLLAGLSLLMALDTPLVRIFYRLKPPVFSALVPTRVLLVTSFSLAVLGGLGLDYWLKRVRKGREREVFSALFLVGLFFFFLWVFTFSPFFPSFFGGENVRTAKRNLVLPTAVLATVAVLIGWGPKVKFKGINSLLPCCFVFLTAFELFWLFSKLTPFSPKELVFPETEVLEFLREKKGGDRFWGYGEAKIDANFATYYGLFSPDGYDALYIKQYGEFLASSKEGRLLPEPPRSDANLAPGFGQSDLRENFYRQRILNLLGVKYVLHRFDPPDSEFKPDDQTFPQETYELVWQKGGWQVYENKAALPRAFLADNLVVEKEKQAILDRLFDGEFSLRESLVLEEVPEGWKENGGGEGTAKIASYQSSRVVVEAESSAEKLLFLSDNFYPGWKAYLDGGETKIYRADYSFRAVVVPPGEHQIIFVYQPESFKGGLGLTLTGSGIIILGVVFSRKEGFLKKKKKKEGGF